MPGGKYFFDTNLLVYFYEENNAKGKQITAWLDANAHPCLSTQVVQEFANVMIRKKLMTEDELQFELGRIVFQFDIQP